MKIKRSAIPFLAILILVTASLACNMPFKIVPNIPEEQAAVVENQGDSDDRVESEAPEATPEPEATPTPELPTPTIEHLVRPGEPGTVNTWVSDRSTKSQAANRTANSDLFNINLLERPYTSEVMDYQAHLDLIKVNLHFSDPWVYVSLVLEGSPPADSQAIYGLELDLDSNGRGDWLILGKVPSGTEWTTEGAKAYKDANQDVGGYAPMNAENPNPAWDGYETLVFEDYLGADPDAVWVRRDPGNPNQVQLAFKYSLIGNDPTFAFGGWADEGMRDPAKFDYNDQMSHDQAGDPYADSSRYPIKELAMVDNTCRWTYGYNPTDPFPGLCPLPATPTPTPTPEPPGSISGGVFNDWDSSRSRNGSEPGLAGITVRIGSGICGSTGLGSTTTNGSGQFTFDNLPAGTYCISIVVPSHMVATTVTQRTASLNPGEPKNIAWFGLVETVD